MYIKSKTKRVFAIDCLGKKLVFHTEICEFREYRILKIGLFHRVKDLSKMNQIGHGVYHGYVDCKTKRIFAIACARKKVSFSYGNLRISRIPNFSKIGLFHRVKDLSKSNQTRYGVSHVYIKSKTKRSFCYRLPGKKVSFSYGNLRISRIPNFKNRSFSSGQGLVQIEPNWVWSIPRVPRL